jgi:hypothetical protein
MEGKKPMLGFSINWRITLYATLLNRGYEMVVSLNGAMTFTVSRNRSAGSAVENKQMSRQGFDVVDVRNNKVSHISGCI